MPDPKSPDFILASASPRRLELLRQIGRAPDAVIPADVDETPAAGELPRDVARRLAEAKARRVAEDRPDAFVLGADTVVACGRRLLEKTEDPSLAALHLALLSGRRHTVFGGIHLYAPEGRSAARLVATAVTFKRLTETDIAAYLDSGEWRGKAGGYAVQGRAARFVKSVNGSYSNVVGLPLFETNQLLDGLGCHAGR